MAELLLVNPRKRRKATKKRKSARRSVRRAARLHARPRKRNPVRKSVSRYVKRRATGYTVGSRRIRRRKMNPIGLPKMGGVVGTLLGGGKGAVGALANDLLMTYVPLPLMLKTGMVGQLSRAAMAFLLGWGTSKLGGKSLGEDFTRGALTVQLYAMAKPMLAQVVPLADGDMGDVGYYNPGTVLNDGVGAYLGASSSAVSPWAQNVFGGDDVDAFAEVGDGMGFYAQ